MSSLQVLGRVTTDCSNVVAQRTLPGLGVRALGRTSEGRRKHGEEAGVPPGDTERAALDGRACGGLRSLNRGGEPQGGYDTRQLPFSSSRCVRSGRAEGLRAEGM
jgi:hypothetical protein